MSEHLTFHCKQPLAAPVNIYDCTTLMSHTHTLCVRPCEMWVYVCAMRRTHAQDQIRCSPVAIHIVWLQYNFAFVMHFLDATTKFALVQSHLNDACRSDRKKCWRRNRYFICLFRFVCLCVCMPSDRPHKCVWARAVMHAIQRFHCDIRARCQQSMENAEWCQCWRGGMNASQRWQGKEENWNSSNVVLVRFIDKMMRSISLMRRVMLRWQLLPQLLKLRRWSSFYSIKDHLRNLHSSKCSKLRLLALMMMGKLFWINTFNIDRRSGTLIVVVFWSQQAASSKYLTKRPSSTRHFYSQLFFFRN